MMSLILNVALLLLATTSTLTAFGGDTWRREPIPLHLRITQRGWVALVCLVATLLLGLTREIRTNRLAAVMQQERTVQAEQLQAQSKLLATQSEHIASVQRQLDDASSELRSTRSRLAAVEPGILE